MKKYVLLIALLVIAFFVMPTYAEKPFTAVEVVNLAENPVPVTTDEELNVNVTNTSPIPVTMPDAGNQKTIVSAWKSVNQSQSLIRGVPIGKIFILTDIVVGFQGNAFSHQWASVKEDTYIKFRMHSGGDPPYTQSFHFVSGIPFAPESEVIGESNGGASFTITGYDIDF